MSENQNVEGKSVREVVEHIKAWGKTIKVAVLGVFMLASSYLVPKLTQDHHAETGEQQQSVAAYAPSQAPVSSTPSAMPSVTFTVQSYGQSKTGKKFLNSLPNYRDPNNQVVVLEGPAAMNLDVASMKGKTITAFGKASDYKGKPQLVVNDPAGVTVR